MRSPPDGSRRWTGWPKYSGKSMKPDFIPRWLATPNETMGGLSPIEAMERGQSDRVWRSVSLLGSGLPL